MENISPNEALNLIIGACESASDEKICYEETLMRIRRYATEGLKQRQQSPSLTPGAPTATGTYFAVVRNYNDGEDMCVLHYLKHKDKYHAVRLGVNGFVKTEDIIGHIPRSEETREEFEAAISQDAHEKEIMMQAFDKVRQIFESRQWIMDGRGSYPYNDDRYKEEVRYMYDEFDQVYKDTWANIKSKSVEYREKIIAEYLKSAAGEEESGLTMSEEEAIELLQYVRQNYKKRKELWMDNYNIGKVTDKGVYELFKQQKEK